MCWTLPARWITLPPTLKPNDWVKLLLGVSGSRLYMLLAASTVSEDKFVPVQRKYAE